MIVLGGEQGPSYTYTCPFLPKLTLGLHGFFPVSLKIYQDSGSSGLRELVFLRAGLERKPKRDKLFEGSRLVHSKITLGLGKGGDLEPVFSGL